MPGSTDGLKSVWPMPRMYATSALPEEEFAGRNETFGAFAVIWNRFVWLRASSISEVTAVMAIGVSCTLDERNSAVTMISSRPPGGPPGCWANAGVAKMAAASGVRQRNGALRRARSDCDIMYPHTDVPPYLGKRSRCRVSPLAERLANDLARRSLAGTLAFALLGVR